MVLQLIPYTDMVFLKILCNFFNGNVLRFNPLLALCYLTLLTKKPKQNYGGFFPPSLPFSVFELLSVSGDEVFIRLEGAKELPKIK